MWFLQLLPLPDSDDVEWKVSHRIKKKLTTEARHKMGDKSKGTHGVAGYSKTTRRDRLLCTSIHIFLVGKGKGRPRGTLEEKKLQWVGRREKKVKRKLVFPGWSGEQKEHTTYGERLRDLSLFSL